MSSRPTELPQWAMQLSYENKTINGVLYSLPNRTSIPTEWANSGVPYGQAPSYVYLNQWMYLGSAMIQHLDGRYSTGDLHLTVSAEDATTISDRLGGTWVQRGTQSVGTVTANVWEKTA